MPRPAAAAFSPPFSFCGFLKRQAKGRVTPPAAAEKPKEGREMQTDPKRVNQILQALEKEQAQAVAHLLRAQKLLNLLKEELATLKTQKEEQQKTTPKRNGNGKPITQKQVKFIHVLRKELGWDDNTYHSWLHSLFRKKSTKDLTRYEATKVIEALKQELESKNRQKEQKPSDPFEDLPDGEVIDVDGLEDLLQ